MLWLLHGGIFNHVAYFLSFSCPSKIGDSIHVKSKKQSLLYSQAVLLRGSALAHADTLGDRICHQGVEPGQERVQWRNYQTRYEAQQDILNYIAMFYNPHRLHSYLGYKSPNQYEAEMGQLQNVA
jgi:hypothetical protein